MCRAVAEALVTKTHLAVQAGTGTGKSLAYLVPAALSGMKVVVATATKALQDQLAGKDLPQVSAGLGVPLDFAVLKGRSNYVCLATRGRGGDGRDPGRAGRSRPRCPATGAGTGRRTGRGPGPKAGPVGVTARGRQARRRTGQPPEGVVDQVRALLAWSQTTKTGDRGDLAFEPSDRAWNMVSVGPRECPGRFNCPSGDRCFAEAARERASLADIVVVNTYLYGAHLASGRAVLPDHDAVVFDEAHELEEVMTSSLGVEVTAGRFRTLAVAGRSLVDERDAEQLETLAALGDRLQELVAERVGERVLGRPGPCRRPGPPRGPRARRAHRPCRPNWRGGSPMRCAPAGPRARCSAGTTASTSTARTARREPSPPRRTSPRTCTGSRPGPKARWPGSTARGAARACASPPSTSDRPWPACSGAR